MTIRWVGDEMEEVRWLDHSESKQLPSWCPGVNFYRTHITGTLFGFSCHLFSKQSNSTYLLSVNVPAFSKGSGFPSFGTFISVSHWTRLKRLKCSRDHLVPFARCSSWLPPSSGLSKEVLPSQKNHLPHPWPQYLPSRKQAPQRWRRICSFLRECRDDDGVKYFPLLKSCGPLGKWLTLSKPYSS